MSSCAHQPGTLSAIRWYDHYRFDKTNNWKAAKQQWLWNWNVNELIKQIIIQRSKYIRNNLERNVRQIWLLFYSLFSYFVTINYQNIASPRHDGARNFVHFSYLLAGSFRRQEKTGCRKNDEFYLSVPYRWHLISFNLFSLVNYSVEVKTWLYGVMIFEIIVLLCEACSNVVI